MKKIKIVLFLVISIALPKFLKAQHCVWDGTGLIEVDVRSKSGEQINGLQITLLDTAGNCYIKSFDERQKKCAAVFWKNPDKTTNKGLGDNSSPLEYEKIRFHFAGSDYIYICWSSSVGKIKIDDIDGKANGGAFETTVINIHSAEVLNLCTNSNSWPYDEKFANSQIIHVTLKKK